MSKFALISFIGLAPGKLIFIIKRVYLNKSSLLLRIDLQNTQTLQLNENGNYLQK
jgi:hypothetical protein